LGVVFGSFFGRVTFFFGVVVAEGVDVDEAVGIPDGDTVLPEEHGIRM
jgi:hypothetical protein